MERGKIGLQKKKEKASDWLKSQVKERESI